MENAAKALFIAAGVLLAILLLTFFRYASAQMGGSTKSIYEMLNQSQVSEFNQQFINYEGRGSNVIETNSDGTPMYDTLTIQDVITIVNLAKDANKAQNAPAPVNIEVNVDGSDWASIYADKTTEEILEVKINDVKNNTTYSCANGAVTVDQSTGLVNKIIITKNTP